MSSVAKSKSSQLLKQPGTKPNCVYCDSRPADTRDHVVSRALFDVQPTNSITVPVCEPCNKEKARDEPYLRDYLTADIHNHMHPTAQALFNGKVKRSIDYNNSDLAHEARTNYQRLPALTLQGRYLGHLTVIPVSSVRVNQVLAKMVRGLLYHYDKKRRIPKDYVIDVGLISPEKRRESVCHMASRPHHGPFKLGGDDIQCIYLQLPDDPAITVWLLQFYRGTMFSVGTFPAEMIAGLS